MPEESRMPEDDRETLLDVRALTVEYVSEHGSVRACDDVSFSVRRGEILGVAGESGLGQVHPDHRAHPAGTAPRGDHGGRDPVPSPGRRRTPSSLVGLSERDLRKLRWRDMAIVLQSASERPQPRRPARRPVHRRPARTRPDTRPAGGAPTHRGTPHPRRPHRRPGEPLPARTVRRHPATRHHRARSRLRRRPRRHGRTHHRRRRGDAASDTGEHPAAARTGSVSPWCS
ncbi:hypothetical protein SALBM311S_01690 [Streptomyces alboniger]